MIGDTDAVLLVGGMGTRLQPVVSSVPKPMACVGDRPFLELLVRHLSRQGIRRLVMCTCHLADQIESEFDDGRRFDVEIKYSQEPYPLGTAGAIKFAGRMLSNDGDFLVLNGDSFLEIDFSQFLRFHSEHGGLVSVAVTRVPNGRRYGTVQIRPDGRVSGLAEKADSDAPGLINAGVYVFRRSVLDHIHEGRASLEKDVFPLLLDRGVYALEQKGMFIDIGTPEDYARAQAISNRLYCAAVDQ